MGRVKAVISQRKKPKTTGTLALKDRDIMSVLDFTLDCSQLPELRSRILFFLPSGQLLDCSHETGLLGEPTEMPASKVQRITS